MRVTNNLIYGQSSQAVSKSNERLLELQEKMAAQTNIIKASDDPVGASQVLQYESSNQQLKRYQDAMDMASSHLEYQEVALDSLNSLLDDTRTLLIQSQNDINTQNDVDAIAQEVAKIVESMADLMNSRNSTGDYIFAGTDTSGPAFVLSSNGEYQWSGNEEQKFAQISDGMKIAVTDSGKKLFQDIWTRDNFDARLQTGQVRLATEVISLGDFSDFMEDNYDPVNPINNNYRLVTTSLSGDETGQSLEEQVTTAVDTNSDAVVDAAQEAVEQQLGDNTSDDEIERYFGPPGEYAFTDGLGNVVASGTYQPGKPIIFNGMAFTLDGPPGATVDFSLVRPSRDNVLNQIKDTLSVLTDKESTLAQRQEAYLNATTSITNTQASIGAGRSSIGARMNVLADKSGVNSASQLTNAIAQNNVASLDVAAAASDLAMAESALTASQKLFARVSNLSLFNQI
ncbi:flagellar hook-associated protein FlgL [Marinomonas epiphytica]